MYQIGDLIHYGSTGVCRVIEVKTQNLPGVNKDKLYYILKPLYQECTISSPIDNQKVFMRPIISKEEAEHIIDTIPNIKVETYHSRVIRDLTEHYEAAFVSHCCEDLIELTMSIYAKKKYLEQEKRKLGSVDERYMKRAEELLFGELAAALEIKKDEVQEYIHNRIGSKVME